ncbi:hypothetical protein ABZ942_13390 [Nocardia sp. NPDC046473]|uniref:hypothetical protein n=1 Tax=Nocardia sp. NPDC046473 TaxID=3155733 RepID=UPI0034024693
MTEMEQVITAPEHDGDLEQIEIVVEDVPLPTAGLAHWFAAHAKGIGNGDADARPARARVGAPRPTRGVLAGIAVFVCAVAVLTATPWRDGSEPESSRAEPAPSPSVNPRPASPSAVMSGNSSGCARRGEDGPAAAITEPGALVIAQFEAAYYLARSARAAREVVSTAAALPDAAVIQAGIDSIPSGTTYCAHISKLAGGLYGVEVHEQRPDEPENVWRQQISTYESGGRTVITSIVGL